MSPEALTFDDDGRIPNSRWPLLLYRAAFEETGEAAARWLEQRFAANGWTNSWRNGVYPFHHFHSNTHEVLGVSCGSAQLHLGGEQGRKIEVKTGDVIVIPAGVGHRNLGATADFQVIGAYPDGREPDLLKSLPADRSGTDENLARVPLPAADPLLGPTGGTRLLWSAP